MAKANVVYLQPQRRHCDLDAVTRDIRENAQDWEWDYYDSKSKRHSMAIALFCFSAMVGIVLFGASMRVGEVLAGFMARGAGL